jgi:RNA polymerase sigma-70 factor, ECF subfamily
MALTAHPTTSQADRELIQRIKGRDQRALMELYQAYSSLVYGLALRVLHNPALAEEVTQDVFLKVWQQPERWNPALGQFTSWLLTITRNAAIDRLRKERHTRTHQVERVEQLAETGLVDDGLWYDGQVLAELLTQLPPEQRLLIELAFFQGYTHSELSNKLRLPLGTVKTRLRSGLQKLRLLWEKGSE